MIRGTAIKRTNKAWLAELPRVTGRVRSVLDGLAPLGQVGFPSWGRPRYQRRRRNTASILDRNRAFTIGFRM